MARVFVSHAGEDLALAREVRRWLVDAGHEVFLDQDLRDGIAMGELWEQRLHERLRWAGAMVCVVTSAYRDSVWCAAEIGAARSRGSRLLPLRAEPDAVHPLLAALQHFDYPADRLLACPDAEYAQDRRVSYCGGRSLSMLTSRNAVAEHRTYDCAARPPGDRSATRRAGRTPAAGHHCGSACSP